MSIDLPPPPRTAPLRDPKRGWPLLALQLVTLVGLVLIYLLLRSPEQPPAGQLPQRARSVASKLKAAGALDEAAGLYERYLSSIDPETKGRAKVAFSLGKLYLEQGLYEKALRWFYEVEAIGAGGLKEDLDKKIVHCLEAMGRVHAAKAVLARQTKLDSAKVKKPESDPVVAKIDKDEVRRSDLERALDDLPPFLKQRFSKEGALADFLKKYVADELIYRKAQKLEYDKDPEVRRQLEMLVKQLVVSRFIEKEILGKLQISSTDLKNHYEANRDRYDQPDSARVRLIQVAGKKKADELKQRLDKGADFEKLAEEASLHNATKQRGGLLDRWVSRGENFLKEGDPQAIAAILFATPKGKVSEPIDAGSHYYLLKVEEIRRGKKRAFEEVQKQVANDYRLEKTRSAYEDLIRQTLSAEEVKLFPERLAAKKDEK